MWTNLCSMSRQTVFYCILIRVDRLLLAEKSSKNRFLIYTLFTDRKIDRIKNSLNKDQIQEKQRTMATSLPFALTVVGPGLKWSVSAAEKAAQKGAFIRVGGHQVTRRFLSGAKRSWTNPDPAEHNTIFQTDYRITGTPENIRLALESASVPADTIAQVIASSITRDNWNTTMAGVYENEIRSRDALKGTKPVAEGYEWPQILWFAQNIKSAVVASKGEHRGTVASPGRARAGESLADKLQKLGPDKVIDVSNMVNDAGKGARTVPRPKTNKSGKIGNFVRNVNIISNNLNNYIRALQIIYGPDAEVTYAPEIEFVRNSLSAQPALAVAPVAPVPFATRASPPRAVGATLAPPAVFTTAVPAVASPLGTIGGGALPALPLLSQLPTLQ